MNKITFFLMGFKGYEVLKHLIERNRNQYIEQVIVAKNLNVQEDYYSQICYLCHSNNIPYLDKSEGFKINTSYSFAVSWRWIIKLNSNQQLIILHDSLLPRLRGFNPTVTALINNHQEIGVTAIFAHEEFDKGDIIDFEKIAIKYPIKIQQAIELLSPYYSAIIDRLLRLIINGTKLNAIKQREEYATYSLWRDDEDYRIDWSQSSEQIVRFINAVGFPFDGAKTLCADKIYIIDDAEEFEDVIIENRISGKVLFKIDDKPVVVCGKGLLKINRLFDPISNESALPLNKFRLRFK